MIPEPERFELSFDASYLNELERIDGRSGYLQGQLERSLYHTLRFNPFVGWQSPDSDLRVLRLKVLGALLLIQVYYRIDYGAAKVTLVSVREVHLL